MTEPTPHKVHHNDEPAPLLRSFLFDDGTAFVAVAAGRTFVTCCEAEGTFSLFMEAANGGLTLYLKGRRPELENLIETLQLARHATAPKAEPEVQRKRED